MPITHRPLPRSFPLIKAQNDQNWSFGNLYLRGPEIRMICWNLQLFSPFDGSRKLLILYRRHNGADSQRNFCEIRYWRLESPCPFENFCCFSVQISSTLIQELTKSVLEWSITNLVDVVLFANNYATRPNVDSSSENWPSNQCK